ncbi:unnamed protein product, partial [Lymnaea stagnalis]
MKSSLPSVSIQLCAFHTTAAVKKALQKKKKLSSSQISCLLDLFIEPRSCTNMSQYTMPSRTRSLNSHLLTFSLTLFLTGGTVPNFGLLLDSPTFHITTTNHAETFHQKIKRVLSAKTPLNICITELLSVTKYTMQS